MTFNGMLFTFPKECTYTLIQSVHAANDLSVSMDSYFLSRLLTNRLLLSFLAYCGTVGTSKLQSL